MQNLELSDYEYHIHMIKFILNLKIATIFQVPPLGQLLKNSKKSGKVDSLIRLSIIRIFINHLPEDLPHHIDKTKFAFIYGLNDCSLNLMQQFKSFPKAFFPRNIIYIMGAFYIRYDKIYNLYTWSIGF